MMLFDDFPKYMLVLQIENKFSIKRSYFVREQLVLLEI